MGSGSHWNCAKPLVSVLTVLETAGVVFGRIQRKPFPVGTRGVTVMSQPGAGAYCALPGV